MVKKMIPLTLGTLLLMNSNTFADDTKLEPLFKINSNQELPKVLLYNPILDKSKDSILPIINGYYFIDECNFDLDELEGIGVCGSLISLGFVPDIKEYYTSPAIYTIEGNTLPDFNKKNIKENRLQIGIKYSF